MYGGDCGWRFLRFGWCCEFDWEYVLRFEVERRVVCGEFSYGTIKKFRDGVFWIVCCDVCWLWVEVDGGDSDV